MFFVSGVWLISISSISVGRLSEVHKYLTLQIFNNFNYFKKLNLFNILKYEVLQIFNNFNYSQVQRVFFLTTAVWKVYKLPKFKNVQDKYLWLKRSVQVFADEPDSSLAKCSEKVCNLIVSMWYVFCSCVTAFFQIMPLQDKFILHRQNKVSNY